MDWTAETNLLTRIVALLLSLADLADRAAAAPRQARCRALSILREAADFADTSIPGSTRDLGAPSPVRTGLPDALESDDAHGAAQLALRLRALALLWASLLLWMGKAARRSTDRNTCRVSHIGAMMPVPAIVQPIDSS